MTEGEQPHRYLAIYEIEGDPAAASKALMELAPGMNMSATLSEDTGTSLFSQITPRMTEAS